MLDTGKTPDISAYRDISLSNFVEALPVGFYVLGDPAYIPTEHMLTPYSGADRDDEGNSIFNFYLSQLRIRIEMAFGQLTTKWRILRSFLTMSLEKASKIIVCCARLQNFYITEDTEDSFEGFQICEVDSLDVNDEAGRGYLPVVADGAQAELITIQGNSNLRDAIRRSIIEEGYVRPSHNIARNVASNVGGL